MRIERFEFSVEAVEAVPGGWRLAGEPGYHPRHWAQPGERFRLARTEPGRERREVNLVVVELTESYAIVSGTGGDLLRPAEIVSGERTVADRVVTRRTPVEAVAHLAAILGLPPAADHAGDWSAVEAELGVTLPGDYKAFIDAYGPGSVDDHLQVCAPGAPEEWVDLVEHNSYAHECTGLEFFGPGNWRREWSMGDASRWTPGREDVPAWFEPGDDLISWGHTGNGDFLYWHVRPGVPPDDWPVVFKERGPLWEQYGSGFATALADLLTGVLQSWYLSSRLGGPHSYDR
ncbi:MULTISPECIES: SMI1/KNR4 family protein [Actinoplanes]|uniref:SMI1/KNR4 family protein n=1 Tax=Actinoplanes TaxID=1865 RepID=UPI000AA8A8E0|nr:MULTISPECIES: SMI1/KNR4 family protein [Actinoplanes]